MKRRSIVWSVCLLAVAATIAAVNGPSSLARVQNAHSAHVTVNRASGLHAGAAAAKSHHVVQVSIRNFAFSPATIKVKRGTKVVWTNFDSAPHTATSDTGVWDSGNLATGAKYSRVFTKTGTFAYHCAVHPFMKAKITVVK